MSEESPRLFVATLFRYLDAGHEIEIREPPLRGRKGPARDTVRPIQITIRNAAAFDSIRWKLMKAALERRGSGGDQH